MARKIKRAARLHLMDLCCPPLQFAVAEVCDQTIGFHTADGSVTITYGEAFLWPTREAAQRHVDADMAAQEERLWASLSEPEQWEGAHDFVRKELGKPREKRRFGPWIEEVRGEATWRAQPDTW